MAFEVTIDMEKRTLLENSQPMVVRELSDDQIVYSRFKPGAFSMLMSDSPTTISRKTGLWRFSRGSGSCKVQETKKLF